MLCRLSGNAHHGIAEESYGSHFSAAIMRCFLLYAPAREDTAENRFMILTVPVPRPISPPTARDSFSALATGNQQLATLPPEPFTAGRKQWEPVSCFPLKQLNVPWRVTTILLLGLSVGRRSARSSAARLAGPSQPRAELAGSVSDVGSDGPCGELPPRAGFARTGHLRSPGSLAAPFLCARPRRFFRPAGRPRSLLRAGN